MTVYDYAETIEEARRSILDHVGGLLQNIVGFNLPYIDLGRIRNCAVTKFVDMFDQKVKCNNSDYKRLLPKLVELEKYVIAKNKKNNLPADESTFCWMIIECDDGYIGLVFQAYSEKAGRRPEYHFFCYTRNKDILGYVLDKAERANNTVTITMKEDSVPATPEEYQQVSA